MIRWLWRTYVCRPILSYRTDRAFGWTRWRALLRCFNRGRIPLYPPWERERMRRERTQQDG